MTPHAGEFKRIFKTTNDKTIDCLKAAKESNSIIVYKGNDTFIGSPNGKGYINMNSSPFLATAGSGDVLAGIIGGLLSQGIDAISSARIGCYVHSQCALNLGPGLIAGDLIKEISQGRSVKIDTNHFFRNSLNLNERITIFITYKKNTFVKYTTGAVSYISFFQNTSYEAAKIVNNTIK